ncbi:MAG TPA: efflux transporter outer membrane subunit [Steroidobacteraceae bacterium]
MNGKSLRATALMALTALVSGCMVGPHYHRPSVPVPAQYQELAGWGAAMPQDAAPKGDWWIDFHDSLLDQLEPRVAISNQTVRQGYANYQQALAEVRVARSELFPTIGVSGSVTRAGGPGYNSANLVTGRTGGVVNSASLEGTAGWTLDLWGRIRRTIEQNAAIAQADAATLANATLSEQILLATTIIQLRITDANIELQRKTVQAYEEALRITKAQGTAGISTAPPSAVITAQVALETAQANLVGLGVARAQYAHAIAVLVGKNPEDLAIPPAAAVPTLPEVPIGVPSTLLQRRPDIAAAERTMAAQNAAVGVAIAAYYPTLSLSAADGFSQSPLNGLLHTANHIWSLGASGSETLLDFGARHGQVLAARAAYEGAVAAYRAAVLSAFEAVENDLSGLRILAEQAQSLDIAVRDATRGAQIALAEFEAGTVDYTTVAQAQQVLWADQQSALTVAENRLVDAVALIGDLGGGWSDSQLQGPPQPQIAKSSEAQSP